MFCFLKFYLCNLKVIECFGTFSFLHDFTFYFHEQNICNDYIFKFMWTTLKYIYELKY